MDDKALERGMATRSKVMGEAHIARRGKSNDRFTAQHQELMTAIAWGDIWSRPGLPLKTRSFVVLGMLTALNREDELRGHINGALNNGATPEEIYEVFVQAAGYCGFPCANGAVRVMVEVFKERGLV